MGAASSERSIDKPVERAIAISLSSPARSSATKSASPYGSATRPEPAAVTAARSLASQSAAVVAPAPSRVRLPLGSVAI